ncbi:MULTISPECIES: iron uptake porin [unclassified Prochlorococcus]|nr:MULTISPECIES: iron uptake porin [unclassified Prochlorococcus]KGG15050.1 putative porin precursor [Prochlorococcus sp. MIT 0602]KGG17321.1 putative porin precursor [Prochlorococcus sp. MIT 0603]
MKLFQQLLVAPAALGLLAPFAANAAEVNIKELANYASPKSSVVTTSQFSDVVPGDWAYTALKNLSDSYGCVDNGYAQNLNSGKALTRYEAAALINSCLDSGLISSELNSDATRLSNEFGTEMAILKGRIDGLEYKVKELSAGQFSSSTKMSGGAVFTTGAIDSRPTSNNNKITTEYNFTLDLNTSFSGSDNLYAQLVQGNQDELVLDSAENASSLQVGSLFYSFPVGDFQVYAGPLLDQDDVISATTSDYSGAFRLATMPWGEVGTTGSGAAVSWANDGGFNASFSAISPTGSGDTSTSGMFTAATADVYTVSVGYDTDYYGGGVVFTDDDTDSSYGAGVYWRPDGFPSISVTFDRLHKSNGTTDSTDLLVGLDYPFGPGTLSTAWQERDTAGVVTNNYEVYYNYPVSDGISIQGGWFFEGDATADTLNPTPDTSGYIVETFFSF